jgi:hypothetical protein
MSNLAAEPDVDVLSIRASCNSRISAFSPWVHSHFMATSLKCSDAGVMYTKEPKIFLHKPVMWCVWKSEIARSARFPDLTYGEDNPWALAACKNAKTERIVPQAIYCYNSDDANSEAGPWRTDSNCGMKIDFVSNEREFVSKHRELLAELKLMGAAA